MDVPEKPLYKCNRVHACIESTHVPNVLLKDSVNDNPGHGVEKDSTEVFGSIGVRHSLVTRSYIHVTISINN